MILPKGQINNPEYYILGHSVSEEEEKSNNIFDVNSNRANSYLDSVLSSMNINELNCRYNKLIKYYVENTYEVSKNDYNKYIDEVLDDIIACNPKIIIGFGSEVAGILLGDRFRYMKSARGRLFDIDIKDHQFKVLVTYSPNYIMKLSDNPEDYQNMTEYVNAFYSDINYSARYVNGDLVDISNKDLRFAKTYDEFKEYFDQYLKDCEFPSYDIESNAKDPRCADFRIVGYSLAPNGNTGIYVIRKTLEYEMPEDDWQKCVEITKEYLMSRKCLVHNIMYEKPATLNEWNINITDFEDSLIKARLLLGGKTGAGLKDQCILNLGYPEWDADLGSYITYFTQLWNDLYPTPAGNNRWDFNYLSEHGFRGLLNCYKEMDKITKELSNKNSDELSKDEEKALKDNYIDDRSRRCMNAMLDLIPLISTYYDENEIEDILELVGKELINLIEIRYSGMLPYSSIPMKIITKYGAMDSVGTHDLNAFLSKRMDNESTETVNLWDGYRVMKEHFIVGSHLEMNGLYWNEEVAKSNYDWLASTAKESLRNCIMSGFLDDQIINNSMYLLKDEVVSNRMEYVRSVLGDFEMQKSAIKLIATGKRISYKNLIWELPQEFIDSMKPWVLQKSKELIMDDTVHKSFEDLKYIFNPASNKNKDILDKILVTNEIQIGYIIVKVREEIEQESFTIESVPMSERILYSTIQNIDKYNKSDECTQKITQRQLFEKVDAVLPQITVKTPMNGYEGSKLYRIINEAMHYHLDGTSEPTMLQLFNYYEAIGIDTEDESTYTPEFTFFNNFRMYKKCTKLISSYIDGSKIGRGSVWTVKRKDIDQNKVEPIRLEKYDWNKPKKDDEEYLMQPTWKVCTAETMRWQSGIHCLHPDTKIRLTDGRNITVKELKEEFDSGKNNYVYSRDEIRGQLQIELIRDVYISHKTHDMVRVYLDNGEYFEVTPDHKMVMRDGSYRETQDLKVGDSLYPINIKIDKTQHELIFDPDLNKEVYCHYLSDDFNERYGLLRDMSNDHMGRNGAWIRHHFDFNPLNNDPSNVNRVGWNTHDEWHKSSEGQKRRWERVKIRMDQDEDYYDHMMNVFRKKYYDNGLDKYVGVYSSENMRKKNLRDNADPEYQKKCQRGKILKFIHNHPEITVDNYDDVVRNDSSRFKFYKHSVEKWFDSLEEAIELSKSYNHNIIKIEKIYYDNPIDVYSVAIYSKSPSFSLSCGVMSKNTLPMGRVVKGMYTSRYKGGVIAAPDYSQLEVRITAGLSKCTSLIEAYKNGEDVHMRTAMGVFNKPAEEITKVERRFCLRSNTKIKLLDGTTKTIKELADNNITDFWVYSWDISNNMMVPGLARYSKKTVKSNKIYRITFDNNKSVECTDNHRFLMLDNSYVEAKNLKLNDRVKPLYFEITDYKDERIISKNRNQVNYLSDGYEIFIDSDGNWYPTHRRVTDVLFPDVHFKGMTRHHKDFNKRNNTPDNLQLLSWSDHMKLHCELGDHNFSVLNPELWDYDNPKYEESRKRHAENISATYKDKFKNDPEYHNMIIDRLDHAREVRWSREGESERFSEYYSEHMKERWKNPDYQEYQSRQTRKLFNNSKLNKCLELCENCYKKYGFINEEVYTSERSLSNYKYSTFTYYTLLEKVGSQELLENYIISGFRYPTHNLEEYKNHRIVNIETIYIDDEDMYDIEVDKYDNFLVDLEDGSGVFVHNCKMATFRILYGSTPEGFASQFLDGDVARARQIFDGFYNTYPEIKEWMNKRHAEVEKYGKVSCENVGYFINIDVAGDPEGIEGAYRKAGNYPIQSQGSMVGGYVLSSINNYLMDHNYYTKPISFIHDSLEFDIHPRELFDVAPTILRMMNDIPINEFDILTEADVVIGTSMGMENEIKKMEFSDDKNEAWMTLEGFEDDLDDMYENWKNNAGYKVVEYENIGEPEPVYIRKHELYQEKLALGPFLGKTRNLIQRKFHLVMD